MNTAKPPEQAERNPTHPMLILSHLSILGLGAQALVVWQWGLLGGDNEVAGAGEPGYLFGPEDPDATGPKTLQGEAFGDADAVSTEPNLSWQRTENITIKRYPSLQPFRAPKGFDMTMLPNQRFPPFWNDIAKLSGIRKAAPAGTVSFDRDGREVVDSKAWRETLERVRITNPKLEGQVGQVLRHSKSLKLRQHAYYGLFYFNDIQNVLDLAAQICAEPDHRTRQDGYRRTLKYLAVHLVESVPLVAGRYNSPVKPKYNFNIWGFLQLPRLGNQPREQAEGLWFMTEVLRIRHDLGRVYLMEIKDVIPQLLSSPSASVRQETVKLLRVIDRNKHKVPTGNASAEQLLAWWDDIAYELLPPVEHVSTGKTILHPSKDLDDIIDVGKQVLAKKDMIGTVKTVSLDNGRLRRGLEIQRLPRPLHLLGIPKGAVITSVNTVLIEDSASLLNCLNKAVEEHQDKKKAREDDKTAPVPPLVFLVQYVHKGRELAKDFHVIE